MNCFLLEQIDNAGLIVDGHLNIDAISKMTVCDIIEFANQSIELTSARDLSQQSGLLMHSASFSLSGSAWPCSSVECRLEKARQLAQFAAFYSDKVFIRNFFVDNLRHLESKKYPNEVLTQSAFANDLVVIQYLRPLIEAGIIVPITTPNHCPHCFVQEVLHQESDKRLFSALNSLAGRYSKELSYSIRKDKKGFFNLIMNGPEDLLEHSFLSILTSEPPAHYKKNRLFRNQVDKGTEVTLSRKMVEEMQLNVHMTDRVFQNIVFELVASQCFNTSYVTEREVEIALLNDITEDRSVQQRDRLIRKYLTCIVPFLGDVSAINILKLREREQDSFILFRQALNKAVDESLSSGKDFTDKSAKQIYQDIIRPELTNLDIKIKNAKSKLLRESIIKIGSWSAAIGVGLYTGFLPAELVLAAKALGLTKVLADISEGIMKKIRPDKRFKNADMYFLWKVRQKAGRL